MSQSIVILIAYFGHWPPWINFFIETCRSNDDIDWVIFTDCGSPANTAANVKIVDTTFEQYKALARDTLRIAFDPPDAYKLCDLRPAFGVVHADIVRNYDFFGYGDLDVVYGQIRDFYTEDILSTYSALSTHPERASGHLFVMKSTPRLIRAFERAPEWREQLSVPEYTAFDELAFSGVLRQLNSAKHLWWKKTPLILFQERYSSPGPVNDMNWYWKNGILTNEFYSHTGHKAERGFLYLHFSHWRSSRYYALHSHVSPDARAPWDCMQTPVIQIDWQEARRDGFMVSPRGIGPIVWPDFHSPSCQGV